MGHPPPQVVVMVVVGCHSEVFPDERNGMRSNDAFAVIYDSL